MDKKQYHINGMCRAMRVYEKAKSKLTKKIFGKIAMWHFDKLESIDKFAWAVMLLKFNKTLWNILGIEVPKYNGNKD
jgi:hypothetical protein